MARQVKRRNPKDKIKIPFSVMTLNSLIRYIRCEYSGGQRITALKRLMDMIDINAYETEPDVYARLRTLQELLKLIVDSGIRNKDVLESAIIDKYGDSKPVIENVGLESNQLSSSECDYIAKGVQEKLQYLEVFKVRDEMIQTLLDLDGSSFETSYYSLVEKLKNIMGDLLMKFQESGVSDELLREFSFSDKNAAELIDRVIKKAKKPGAILQTGIRQLNALLNPGFQGGRLYTILGGSGKFKSGTLLNLADQIRQFNPQVIPFEDGLQKTILFITMENSIEETLERLYDMYADMNDELREKDTKDVIETLKNAGQFVISGNNGIDITIIYRGNLEISTSDIYGIMSDLMKKGKKPICIFLDYIKRIQSAHPNMGDERVRMSYAAKELKNIARFFQIPVITAMQLNRSGNEIIDAAMRDSKQDVARFVGSASIGNAWDIIEDSDWVGLINLEMQRSTNQLFLTMKLLKWRGKKNRENLIDYFNHPFTNSKCIRLLPDVNSPQSASIISLATDLESIDDAMDLKSAKTERLSASKVASDNKSTKVLNSIRAIQLDSLVS